jgi:hypothetical protein
MSKKEDEAIRDYGRYEYDTIYRMYKPGAANSDNYVADRPHDRHEGSGDYRKCWRLLR